MNLGKVKTFLIVLFLGINIYLIASHFMATTFYVDDKTIDSTIEIIKGRGIEVDKDTVIKYTVNLKNVDTNNIIYTDGFDTKKNGYEISGDEFKIREESRDIYSKSDKAIHKEVKAFLEQSGFDTKHMKFSKISEQSDKKSFKIVCRIRDYEIFDSRINVNVDKNGYTLMGSWFEPQSDDTMMNSRSRKAVYITSVLMDLAENEDAKKNLPFKITDIDYGYLSGTLYGGDGHVTATAQPCYRIKDNKSNVYYYDASDGTYIK